MEGKNQQFVPKSTHRNNNDTSTIYLQDDNDKYENYEDFQL